MDTGNWKNAFVNCLMSDDSQGAYRLKVANAPKFLYKYRTVNDFSITNLRNDTVWISSPAGMNDPFDSKLHFKAALVKDQLVAENLENFLSMAQLRSYFKPTEIEQIISAANPMQAILNVFRLQVTDKSDEFNLLMKILAKIEEKHNQSVLDGLNSTVSDSLKLCSFSGRKDVVLMWSHYSSNHQGFCVEYDFSEDFSTLRFLYPIIYSENMFDATNILLEKNSYLLALLASLYKAPEWAYEEEWRLIFPFGIVKNDKNHSVRKPSAIYLGARINDNHFNLLKDMAREKSIPLYKMNLSSDQFRLTAVSVPY